MTCDRVCARNRDSARRLMFTLRKLLPECDVGLFYSGIDCDADDVIVTPYSSLKDLSRWDAGVFLACDIGAYELMEQAEAISAFRNAARWGIMETPLGGNPDIDLVLEGFFGPACASTSLPQVIESGFATPVVVCWLPAPRVESNGCPYNILEAMSMQENKAFCDMVSEIIRRTPDELGCLCYADWRALAMRLDKGLVALHKKIPPKTRMAVMNDIASGKVRKAVFTPDFTPPPSNHGVLVLGSCRGDSAARRIPGRPRKNPKDTSYIVTFSHDWDMHNGRPGHLALNDEARKRRFHELGFRQMYVGDVNQLPFLGS